MDSARPCATVIPCYNEAASIGEVVQAVRHYLSAVIVVDDGSNDRTAQKAAAAGAEVVRHASNRGKGAALRTGWDRARARGFAWALTMDGDGQHDAKDIPALLACANRTGAALVVGNRMGSAKAMPALRRYVNRWMTRRLSKLAGAPLADSQCGFRLVNLESLSRHQLTATHFEIESEMLLAFVAGGDKVEFAPVEVIYKMNPSKIHPLVDTWRWFLWWFMQRKAR